MPTIALYVEIPENQLKRVAEQVLRWIEEGAQKRKIAHFVNRYNNLKNRLFPGESIAPMHRWRVLQFTNLARGRPSRNVRVPRCREVELIAAVIGMTVEGLLGIEDPRGRNRLDAMEGPENAATLLELMRKYQPQSDALIAWAKFLPCSLETSAFMHAHHQALFTNSGDVMTWDGVGNTRRSELLAAGVERNWTMVQINFLSDLRRIARGAGEYAAVPAHLRRECLKNLADMVMKPELKIKFFVIDDAEDEAIATLKCDLSNFDSVILWDKKLMISRDHLGITYYSERPRHIGYWRGMMSEMMGLAKYINAEQVEKLLRSLAAGVPETQPCSTGHLIGRLL